VATSRSRRRGKAFVHIQNDVTAEEIRLAYQESYKSVEHLKRYTTLGMGSDQGKSSGLRVCLRRSDGRDEDLAIRDYAPGQPGYKGLNPFSNAIFWTSRGIVRK
jgi:sarcosine oxidase subunit alpha